VGNQVFTLVVADSTKVITGLSAGPVFEASLVRTPKRADAARPLWPFAPFDVHATSSQSVMVCFTQPVDPSALLGSQFSLGGVEVKSASATFVPQCVSLATAPLPRNATLVLAVDGVKAKSGDVTKGTRSSVVAPDVATPAGMLRTSVPADTRGVVPLDDLNSLVTGVTQFGRMDTAGAAIELLTNEPPLPAGATATVRTDPSVQGFWVAFERVGSPPKISLRTATGVTELGGADVINGGLFSPAGDGTLLVQGADAMKVLRLSATSRDVLTAVTAQTFRGMYGVGQVLVDQGARLGVLTLPNTLETQTFELPTGVSRDLFAQAFDSEGVTWWCASGALYRLADMGSAAVGLCSRMQRDARGVLWVTNTSSQRLFRVQGMTVREVTATNPFDATKRLIDPQFKGGAVWFDDTLRIDEATWRQLAGEM
jgi:hypothetical protein